MALPSVQSINGMILRDGSIMTNWEKYFGTPEKAAETRVKFYHSDITETCGIEIYNIGIPEVTVIDVDGYLDWLKSEAEDDFDYNNAMASLYPDTEYIINKSAYDCGVEGVKEEIVRCRDCVDCNEEGVYTPQYYCLSKHWNYQSWQGTPTDPDGFCKWGKRR